jgi:hypothetical protein
VAANQQRALDAGMYLPRVFDSTAHAYRVRYAIANILRDRAPNEGAFKNCFEMEDGDEVILDILRRGLRNAKLRAALEASHLVNLTDWLIRHPEYSEAYYAASEKNPGMFQCSNRKPAS